ncbi:hypothetical protein ACP4OV_026544 [Aristida adscensionis]
MAPSASMLFLSYHQLHRPAEAAPPRRKEEEGEAGGARLSLSGVLSLGALARRREAAAPAEGKRARECDAGEEKAAAVEAAELEGRFEEALRLSCWSS